MFLKRQTNNSIQRSLVRGAVAGGAIVLTASLVSAYFLVRLALEKQFDTPIRERLESIPDKTGFMIHPEKGVPIFVNQLEVMEVRSFRNTDLSKVSPLIEIRSLAGATVYRSPSLVREGFHLPWSPEDGRSEWFRREGRHFRVVTVQVPLVERLITSAIRPRKDRPKDKYDPEAIARVLKENKPIAAEIAVAPETGLGTGEKQRVWVALARPAGDLHETLVRLATVLVGVYVATLCVMVLTLRRIVVSQLSPLRVLAKEIERIDGGNLEQRVRRDLPKELRPAADRLNELLDNLNVSLERERAFSSNLAYEFKTPLAGIRAKIDLARTREGDLADYRQTLDDCQTISLEMEATVESMLMLARLEGGNVRLERKEIPLAKLVDRLWWDYLEQAEANAITLENEIPAGMALLTDPTLLRIILRNLLENGIVHGTRGVELRVEGWVAEPIRRIQITSRGSRLTQADADRVCERFWRGDRSRNGSGKNCGLGLSLVRQSIQLLGGRMEVRSIPGGEFQVELTLEHLPLERLSS